MKNTIPFSQPSICESDEIHVLAAIRSRHIAGDKSFSKLAKDFLEREFNNSKVLLTSSATDALEMSGLLLDIGPGDEVILPSFTFPSTATAFLLRGAKLVFVDIEPETLGLDPMMVQNAITHHTRAIVPVHYAGSACRIADLVRIGRKHGIPVVEDAAQGVFSYSNSKPLGSFGEMGVLSFHETKNITCGEGGALIINELGFVERAEIIREKGTNRKRFYRGEIDKYGWVDIGSSFLMSDLNAALLYSQLLRGCEITKKRRLIWNRYFSGLFDLEKSGRAKLPTQMKSDETTGNGHIFFLILKNEKARDELIAYLKSVGICAVFHYQPLHSSEAGQKYGRMSGGDEWTSKIANGLIRLPLYYDMSETECDYVISHIRSYFEIQS